MTILLKWSIRLIFFLNTILIGLVATTFLSFKLDHMFIEKKILTLQHILKSGNSFAKALQQSHPAFEKLVIYTDDQPSSRLCFEIKKWGPAQYQNSQDLRKILNDSQMLESLNHPKFFDGCHRIEMIFHSDSFLSGLQMAHTKIEIDQFGLITKIDDFFIF